MGISVVVEEWLPIFCFVRVIGKQKWVVRDRRNFYLFLFIFTQFFAGDGVVFCFVFGE